MPLIEFADEIQSIPANITFTATEYAHLQNDIWSACTTAQTIGLCVGLFFGAMIGILLYRRKYGGILQE